MVTCRCNLVRSKELAGQSLLFIQQLVTISVTSSYPMKPEELEELVTSHIH